MLAVFMDWLSAIHFQQPGWLWGWPLSLLAIGLLVHGRRLISLTQLPELSGVQHYRHPRLGILRQLYARRMTQQSMRGAWYRWSQYAVLLLCLHLALAQPYRLGQQIPAPPEYRDTLFMVDTSISMVLRDYLVAGERTDRMTILKSVLTHFIEQLKGNRIGLIAFSEQAYTLAPLTDDYALLKSQLRRLRPAVLTGRTTDISHALMYTLRMVQQTSQGEAQRKPALVLITDVNRSPRDLDPRAIAAYLHEQGFRLYTVGIGASSDEAQEEDSRGLIYQPANFSLLEELAENGGGRFYWADNVSSLQGAIQAIQSAERQQVQTEPRQIKVNLYQWPLLAGLGWMLILQGWTRQRRQGRQP